MEDFHKPIFNNDFGCILDVGLISINIKTLALKSKIFSCVLSWILDKFWPLTNS